MLSVIDEIKHLPVCIFLGIEIHEFEASKKESPTGPAIKIKLKADHTKCFLLD